MKQLSGGRPRPKYRLSPNEVEQLKKEETERRRKLRIVQVREQAKVAAAQIRQNVKQERKNQLVKLAHEVQNQLEAEQEEEIRKLEQHYNNTLRAIGQGHTHAMITDKNTSHAEQQFISYENKQRANERHKEALRKVTLDKAYKEYRETQQIRDRHAALVEEKKRAAEVASRPPPPPDPIDDALEKRNKLKRPIPLTDMNAFSATHYHVPDFAVEKAPLEQQHDAKSAGEDEDQRTKEEISERQKREHDQLIQARIRGNEALKKEMLKHDYDALMADLSLQQRADRRRRQHVVSKLPKQVFLPPDRRVEELEDKQMEMERAFEDMYMKQMNLSGDLSLTLDPKPLAGTPREEVDDSLEMPEDSPVVIPSMPLFNPALRELTNVSRSQPGQVAGPAKPETTLKKLLNRIKEQRSEAESGTLETAQENQETHNKETAAAARQPVAKPFADPQLDLSPLKDPGNHKPQKIPLVAPEEADPASSTDWSEAGFLQQLQGRLQAIELQRDHLDRLMKERQQQEQQQHQQQPLAPAVPTQTAAPASASQGHTVRFAPTLAGPHTPSQANVGQWLLTHTTGGPARDVSELKTPGIGGDAFSAQALSTAATGFGATSTGFGHTASQLPSTGGHPLQPTYQISGYAGQSSVQMSTSGYSGQLVNPMSAGSGYPSSSNDSAAGSRAMGLSVAHSSLAPSSVGGGLSAGVGGTIAVASAASSTHPYSLPSVPPMSAFGPVSASVGRPLSGVSGLTTGSASLPAASAQLGLQAASAQATLASSGILPSSQTLGAQLPTSLAFQQRGGLGIAPMGEAGDSQSHGLVMGQSGNLRPLLSDSGAGIEERVRRLREFQQQLIAKHQERMKALEEVGAGREAHHLPSTAPAPGSLSSSLLESRSLADPASLVPYTLRTSLLPNTTTASSFAASSLIPTQSVSFGTTSLPPPALSRAGASQYSASLGVRGLLDSAVGSQPLLGGSQALTTSEPILAGSSGIMGGQSSTLQGPKLPEVTDGGDRKLDTVRKSLPFDNVEDTPHGVRPTEEGGGDIGGISADDSHLSSSTERGSPALGAGSRSNKSSTTSGSGLSGMSDGSLGGSSLVARAEEKRLSFEQRQRELQEQLAEIQRQRDALLQRYHGNQQRVSAQEENLRSKLKTAKAVTGEAAAMSSLSEGASLASPHVVALGLGVRQSASPSSPLEEVSLTSERLSASRSWAMELEECSLSAAGGGGGGAFKSPSSLTLEEFSINSDISAKDGGKPTDRSADARPGSSLSSLEEYSFVSSQGKPAGDVDRVRVPLSAGAGSREASDHSSQDERNSHRGPLDIKDLLQELGSKLGEARSRSETTGITWSDILKSDSEVPTGDDAEATRLPPPPIRQPLPLAEYHPHELSTILEVDTPQTGTKRPSPVTIREEGGVGEKPASRRYIQFARHGGGEDDRESKLSASGSSASSDVRSVIEVRPALQKSGGTASTASGSAGDPSMSVKTEERVFRENILEASSMKGTGLGPDITSGKPGEWQDVSYASTGQGFRSLELTMDSLTPRSASADNSQGARRPLDVSGEEGPGMLRVGGSRAEEVLRQARQFNEEMMSAIQQQSADVFAADQSSLSAMSLTTPADADCTQTSQ